MVIAISEVEAHAFIEIDRDTVHLPTVLNKCSTYLRYRQTGTEQASSGVFPAVLWIAPDQSRADKLRAAIRRDPELPDDLFTICETVDAIRALARLIEPSPVTRKEVSP